MMDDGRLFTDYRSSQVREELFRFKNCVISENEARTLRINNAEQIMDDEWEKLLASRSCFPRKNCYHTYPRTLTSTAYNNAELLAYNGMLPSPKCNIGCHDNRLTDTSGSRSGRRGCEQKSVGYNYDGRYPERNVRTKRFLPDGIRHGNLTDQ
jgi:hypothetical protein